ncbi:CAP domain-containing protein [Bacillaceae bacterium YX66]
MKHLVIATLVGVGLLGSQVGTAEAANQVKVQTKVNYHSVTVKDWNSFKNWCNVQFKDYQPNKKQSNKQDYEVKQPAPQPDQPKQEQPAPAPTPAPTPAPAPEKEQPKQEEQVNNGLTAEEQQMLNLVNQERQKQGLQPLKANLELTKVARVKAKDMIDNNYFSHQSPTYGSPFDMMKQFGISYRTAGENLAGNQTVEKAHNALMNSDGHRANILNANYTEVGIGIVAGGPYGKMFVQLFKG